jgi:predicted  nucleic acid-binding Zn-ribbon protein
MEGDIVDSTNWLYILSGIVGGTGFTSLLRYLSTRRTQSISLEERLRAEMFEQIDKLKTEINDLKADLENWRDKYLTLHKEHVKLKAEFDKLTKDR